MSFGSGNDLVDGGLAAGKARGRRLHRQSATTSPPTNGRPSWTFTGMARDLQLLYTVGHDLANSDRWPNWGKDSEFRSIRDASAAERR